MSSGYDWEKVLGPDDEATKPEEVVLDKGRNWWPFGRKGEDETAGHGHETLMPDESEETAAVPEPDDLEHLIRQSEPVAVVAPSPVTESVPVVSGHELAETVSEPVLVVPAPEPEEGSGVALEASTAEPIVAESGPEPIHAGGISDSPSASKDDVVGSVTQTAETIVIDPPTTGGKAETRSETEVEALSASSEPAIDAVLAPLPTVANVATVVVEEANDAQNALTADVVEIVAPEAITPDVTVETTTPIVEVEPEPVLDAPEVVEAVAEPETPEELEPVAESQEVVEAVAEPETPEDPEPVAEAPEILEAVADPEVPENPEPAAEAPEVVEAVAEPETPEESEPVAEAPEIVEAVAESEVAEVIEAVAEAPEVVAEEIEAVADVPEVLGESTEQETLDEPEAAEPESEVDGVLEEDEPRIESEDDERIVASDIPELHVVSSTGTDGAHEEEDMESNEAESQEPIGTEVPLMFRQPEETVADETHMPAFVPRDLVEPSRQQNRFDVQNGEDDGYVPAALRSAEKARGKKEGKYFVGEDIQEPSFILSDEDSKPLAEVHIDEILAIAVERRASDIHLSTGLPPMMRMDGEVIALNYEVASPEQTQRLIYEILSDEHLEKFEQTHELDFGYTVRGLARFRCNVYMQRGSVAAALRMIPNRIPTYDELRLPVIIREIAKRSSGLILVTGPTGSGKSTSIAAMIDDINETRQGHIITIEDPIEYLHRHKRCMVNQREMHSDTYSFHNALRAVLREDPDILLVGELRDLETIEAALTLAETGHLVFGTLHTRNAPSTIDRVVDVFPADQQDQIRILLANTIEGIVSQQLLPKLGGGRIAAIEIMTGVAAVRNLIREGKTHQMYSVIETSKQQGMMTMDSSLAELFRQGYVSYEECMLRAVDKETFARLSKSAA